jgi:hypothetical protein
MLYKEICATLQRVTLSFNENPLFIADYYGQALDDEMHSVDLL